MPAGQPGVPGLSASAILAVAEGLRWTDPQLSVALAEHVARAAGADASARTAAERSAVLALGQSDRCAELIVRALPHLRAAEREGRIVDAGTLRCELSLAALRCGDVDAAETLLEPLAAGRVLPPAVRADALVAWAAARATRGDVAGVDAAGRQVDDLVGETADDARRLAMRRARAEARRHTGDTSGALEVLRVAVSDANVADGGRQAALLLADRVELLAGLGRRDEAREAGTPALTETSTATTSLALGRLRCVLAQHVHVPAGEFETAERLAREAETDLAARGHEAQVAVAVEVLAAVAEGRGDARQALEELRRARPHLEAAHEEATRARAALAAALSRDEDRIPSVAATGDSPDRATGEDADGAWATVATRDADPADIATDTTAPTVAEPAQTFQAFALDGLPTSSGPEEPEESAPESDAVPDDPPEPAAEPATEAAAEPRRRRNRYREEGDPGDLLAAALAAARGEFVAFSTAPATAAPTATGTEPPEHGPTETLTDDASRTTTPGATRPGATRPGATTPRAPMTPRPPGAGGSPGPVRGGRRRSRSCPAATTCPGPPAPTTGATTPWARGTTSTSRPAGAPTRTGAIPSRIVDTGPPASGERAPTTAIRSASGVSPPGCGTRNGSGPGAGRATPSTTRTPRPSPRVPAPPGQARTARPARTPVTRAAGASWAEAAPPGTAPAREVPTTSWRGSWRSPWSTSSASTRTPVCRSGEASRTARRRR